MHAIETPLPPQRVATACKRLMHPVLHTFLGGGALLLRLPMLLLSSCFLAAAS